MFPGEEHQGIVSIEPPCVYFYSDRDDLSADGLGRRIALSLSYPLVRLDEGTRTLWNGGIPIAHGDRDIGPIATGDRVIADPISLPDFNDNGYGNHKQPHKPVINDPCGLSL